jgi:hypothetical protein
MDAVSQASFDASVPENGLFLRVKPIDPSGRTLSLAICLNFTIARGFQQLARCLRSFRHRVIESDHGFQSQKGRASCFVEHCWERWQFWV